MSRMERSSNLHCLLNHPSIIISHGSGVLLGSTRAVLAQDFSQIRSQAMSYLEVFLHIYLAIDAGCQLGLQLEHLPVTLPCDLDFLKAWREGSKCEYPGEPGGSLIIFSRTWLWNSYNVTSAAITGSFHRPPL